MFLKEPHDAEAAMYLDRERVANGYVMNLERAWAWRPDVAEGFARLRRQLMEKTTLAPAELTLLACVAARELGDSYCSLAFGAKLAGFRGTGAVADLLRGGNPPATARDTSLRNWAAQMVRDPSGSTARQVEDLRAAGLTDREIFEATVQVALRLAFSTVNAALGARPDHELTMGAPPEIRAAITYGRPPCAPGAQTWPQRDCA
jgi:alkylhydroperoxidase family enzyme